MPSFEVLENGDIHVKFPENGTSYTIEGAAAFGVNLADKSWHDYVEITHIDPKKMVVNPSGPGGDYIDFPYENITLEDLRLAVLQQTAPEVRSVLGLEKYDPNTPPVVNGDMTQTPLNGYVYHLVSDDNLIVLNVTASDETGDHPFHPGYVLRTVAENEDGTFDVISFGIGVSQEGVIGGSENRSNLNEIMGNLLFSNDINLIKQALVNSAYRLEQQCFPAGTLITLADNTQKPIEDIRHGDIVLSHDKNGDLVPSVVDKLFTNTTDAFIRLSFDDRDDLIATPGHHFLTETGDYMEIGHMARLGGGQVRIVDTDGSIIIAKAERIIYSAETSDVFEQAATKTIAYSGNTVLKENHTEGWKTYNFEVCETHTYIAGGIRVHNKSVLDFLQPHELANLKDVEDTNGDGKLDSARVDLPIGGKTYTVTLRGQDGSSLQAVREVLTADGNGDPIYARYISDANGNFVKTEYKTLDGVYKGENVAKSLTPVLASMFVDGDSSVFEKVAAETVIGTTLGNLGEIIGGLTHLSTIDGKEFSLFTQLDDLSSYAFADLGGDLVVAGAGASISIINQLILSEIFEGADLDGIDGAVLKGITSYGINEIIRAGAGNIITSPAFVDVLKDAGFSSASIDTVTESFSGSAFDNFKINIPSVIFSAVFNEIVPPIETLEGQSAQLITNTLIQTFQGTLNIATGWAGPIGLVVGYIIGKVFDELFGDDPEPQAFANIGFDAATGHFKILDSWSKDGGDEGMARATAQKYVDGINGFVDTVMSNSNNYSEIGQWSIGHYFDQLKNAGANGRTFKDFQELYINSYINTVKDAVHKDGQMAAVKALEKLDLAEKVAAVSSSLGYMLAATDKIYRNLDNPSSYTDALKGLATLGVNFAPRPDAVTPEDKNWNEFIQKLTDLFADKAEDGYKISRSEFVEIINSSYDVNLYTEEEIFQQIGAALTIADDYHKYLENQEAIDIQIAMNPDSAFAAGWVATLLQAKEMGLADPYNLKGDAISNNFFTADGNDNIHGMGGNDDIRTYGGNDSLDGGNGADKMSGESGNDYYWVDNFGDVVVEGADGGTDQIYGYIDIDLARPNNIYANVENVVLNGTTDIDAAGNDAHNRLIGNSGDNRLAGRAGSDLITGGEGADTFLFRKYYDQEVITDFKDNVDAIELMNFAGISNFIQTKSFAKQSGTDVIFDFGNNDILTVKNITIAALEDDLIFA